MGRQAKINAAVKEKIEDGFSRGLNKSEVCLHAGISRPTLNSYMKTHKRFNEHCGLLMENVKMHAKLNIAKAIIEQKDLSTSRFYYERQADKEEKAEMTNNGIIFREDIPTEDSEQWFGDDEGG